MRILFRGSDCGLCALTVSDVYYDEGEFSLCFYSSSGDMNYYIDIDDPSSARYILNHLLIDGWYDLSRYTAYPIDESAFSEE